ncbi:hypothetical protein ACIP5Y_24320 [Nocardia sp. NPDC088792]|uniref:hypothetical protein n=1 Tax=Nocardia sp. NPDC088792 TaxID=3364332 RepID=UPI00380DAC99
MRPRLIDVGQTEHGDHVVEHSGAEPAPHGVVVAQQLLAMATSRAGSPPSSAIRA